ncbi:MAG: type II toxin-antitoxin system RelE/ParE family toxin [Bryobacteraceae bacterium]|nr:type II toxin-antitoxin system RelE/ParE family toxin [Bryobacteraceae bacterium]
MKRYTVVVTAEAQTGIRESFLYIFERSPENAAVWLQGLYNQIDTLERTPERCAYARERIYLDEDLRQLIYKSHRVVFCVDHKQSAVYVLHVRHGKRRAIGEQFDGDE